MKTAPGYRTVSVKWGIQVIAPDGRLVGTYWTYQLADDASWRDASNK